MIRGVLSFWNVSENENSVVPLHIVETHVVIYSEKHKRKISFALPFRLRNGKAPHHSFYMFDSNTIASYISNAFLCDCWYWAEIKYEFSYINTFYL